MTDDTQAWTSTGMSGYSEKGIPEEWDFGFGSVTGYRWWWWHVPPRFAGYVDQEWAEGRNAFSYLIGAYRGEWEPGRIEAKCGVSGSGINSFRFERLNNHEDNEHLPPANRCGCGFWGYFDPDLPMSQILGSAGQGPKITRDSYLGSVPTVKIPILGAIEGTGRVVIGEKGFRSQYAKLKALCVPDEARKVLSHWVAETPKGTASKNDLPDSDFAYIESGGTGRYEYRDATESEIMSRLTEAEEVLSELYPDAKVCPDRNSMIKQFPKDEYYGEQYGEK